MKRLVLALGMAGLLVSHAALAQTKQAAPTAKRGAPGKKASASKAVTRKDATLEMLSRLEFNRIAQSAMNPVLACKASAPAAMLWSLDGVISRMNLEKGEYETTAEHAARMEKLEKVLTDGGLDKPASALMFCVPLSQIDTDLKYDADNQAFELNLNEFGSFESSSRKTGSYVSSTRMGVKARVTSYLDVSYQYRVPNIDQSISAACYKPRFGRAVFKINVDRDRAPAVKLGGYLAIYGRLVAPFFSKSDTPGSPTLDDPTDTREVNLTMTLRATKLAIVGPDATVLAECLYR